MTTQSPVNLVRSGARQADLCRDSILKMLIEDKYLSEKTVCSVVSNCQIFMLRKKPVRVIRTGGWRRAGKIKFWRRNYLSF